MLIAGVEKQQPIFSRDQDLKRFPLSYTKQVLQRAALPGDRSLDPDLAITF
jgi:hypothetical protein